MKISEVTPEILLAHCGISNADPDVLGLLEAYKAAAVRYISSSTGIPAEKLDEYEDLTIAYLCLVDDMYNNRDATADKTESNPTVQYILGLHSRNLLS